MQTIALSVGSYRLDFHCGPITLAFSTTGDNDTFGGSIDDVSISAIPIPAAPPLLLIALVGFGFVARRRLHAA